MMRRLSVHYLMAIFMLLFALPLSAQELTVKSFVLVPDDATARDEKYQRVDGNGTLAGLVKVQIALSDVKLDGSMVLDQKKWSASEYWVWMADRATKLTVVAPGFLPLEVNFRNYDFQMLHSKNTYKLVITVPTAGVQQDDGKGFLAFTVDPKSATLTIDGQDVALVDGEYSRLVDRGTYNYEVSAQGYARQSGSVEVGDNTPTKVIKLESILSTLQVSCATQGAQIYIDGKQRGTAPQTLTLSTEPHRIEAKLDGYRTYKEDITLGERENRRLDIPALERLTGSLRVNYKPLGSDVYVDGVKVGSNPGTFRNIGVGSHKVEIRKDGYVTASVNATVNENQAAELSGTLAQSAVPVQNNNNNAVVSQPSSSWGDLQTFEVKGVKFKMVRVQGGTFQMGATPEQGGDAKDDEKPAHSVTLDTYLIGETEVTQELWEAVMSTNPSSFKGAKNPVEQVSWDDCKVFINKLNDLTGQHFRLPTEAEWEFAARGGNKSGKTKYSGSNTIDDVAWYWQNSGDKYLSGTDSDWSLDKVNAINCKTHPVRTKKANELGIYDMSGNVWEWCEDRYGKEYYGSSPQNNPKGAATGSDRVLRGGSWYSRARSCRVSNRNYSAPFDRSYYLGFRLAL